MFSAFPLFPEQASSFAGEVDALYFFLVAVSGFFAVLIALLVIVFAVRYRRRSDDEMPRPIHGSLALEILWSVVPFGIAMVIFFWGAKVFLTIARPPDDAVEMFVVGKQWMWKIQHMEGRREINELHVPVGRAVKLTMTSEDVIHSFFIPAFRTKADVLPGRYTTLWFKPTKPGTYHLFCAEYCGTEHAKMGGRVIVMEPAEYQEWLSSTASAAAPSGAASAAAAPAGAASTAAAVVPAADSGEALFQKLGCLTCHPPQGGGLGPNLGGVPGSEVKLATGETVVADDQYLRESILNPQAQIVAGYPPVMPTFQGQVNEEQLMQLLQYIKSLPATGGHAAPAAGAEPGEPAGAPADGQATTSDADRKNEYDDQDRNA